MSKLNFSKVKSKTIILLVVVILLAGNIGILFSYYKFYISDRMLEDLTNARNQNYKCLYEISDRILSSPPSATINILKQYVKQNDGYVVLKDKSKNVLYTNKSDISKMFSSSIVIYKEGTEYEITYSKIASLPGLNIIKNIIFYEILVVSLASILVFLISTKKYIDPIETITSDITNYKFGKRPFKRKMPKKMQKIQNTFVDMVDSLESEKENQNQIIASISHDIKTPLTSVIGYANRLNNSNLTDEKRQKYIDKICNKSLLIKNILEEFDDYQSCNIKETMKFEEVSAKEICNIIRDDFEDELMDKKIILSIDCNCDNDKVLIDIVKIKRVFGNVIVNTIRLLNGKGGIIKIQMLKKEGKINFNISDNAGGIKNEKDLKKIFEPLYTSDPSRKISGLGLSICKQIISAHDGRIYAKNNQIGGLSIVFILPIYNLNKI